MIIRPDRMVSVSRNWSDKEPEFGRYRPTLGPSLSKSAALVIAADAAHYYVPLSRVSHCLVAEYDRRQLSRRFRTTNDLER